MVTKVAEHIDHKGLKEMYGKPAIMHYYIVDRGNEIYSVKVGFEEGWKRTDMLKAIADSFMQCNEEPEEIFITELRLVV